MSKKSLFIVLGNELSKLFSSLDEKIDRIDSKPSTDASFEPFSLWQFNGSYFLCLHSPLVEYTEYSLLRLNRFVSRLCGVRTANNINGLICLKDVKKITSSQNVQSAQEHVQLISFILKKIHEKIAVNIPFFFINTKTSADNKNLSSKYLYNFYAKENVDYCKFIYECNNLSEILNHSNAVNFQFNKFLNDFQKHCFENLQKDNHASNALKRIHNFYHARSTFEGIWEYNLGILIKDTKNTKGITPSLLVLLNLELCTEKNFIESICTGLKYCTDNVSHNIVVSETLLDRYTIRNNLLVILTTAFSAILSTILYCGYKDLKNKHDTLQASVYKLNDLIQHVNDIPYASEEGVVRSDELFCELFTQYEEISGSQLKSKYIFPSWGNGFSKKLNKKYEKAFSKAFVHFFIKNYINQTNFYLKEYNSINKTQEDVLFRLKDFISFFQKYNINYYNLTSKKPDYVKNALIQISNTFIFSHCGEERKVEYFLNSISDEDLRALQDNHVRVKKILSEKLLWLVKQEFEKAFSQSSIFYKAIQFSNSLNDLNLPLSEKHLKSNKDTLTKLNSFRRLSNLLHDYEILSDELTRTQFVRLLDSDHTFTLINEELFSKINTNPLVNISTKDEIKQITKHYQKQFDEKLKPLLHRSPESQITVLSFDKKNQLIIDENLQELFQYLSILFNKYKELKLDLSQNYKDLNTLKYTEKFEFDLKKLQYALQTQVRLHEHFDEINFKNYSDNFTVTIHKFISDCLQDVLLYQIYDALQFTNHEFFNSRAISKIKPEDFSLTSAALAKIQEFISSKEYINIQPSFEKIVLVYMDSFLTEMLSQLEQQNLFIPNFHSVKKLSLETPLILQMFSANSETDIKNIFENDKKKVFEIFAKNLQEPINLITSVFQKNILLNLKSYRLWESIAENYEEKKSSYRDLESFVLNDLKDLKIDDCNGLTKNYFVSKNSIDYFDNKKSNLIENIQLYCSKMLIQSFNDQYNKVADFFDLHIAGKYPFSANIQVNKSPENVQFTDWERFLKDVETLRNLYENIVIQNKNQKLIDDDIKSFLTQVFKLSSIFPKTDLDKESNPFARIFINFSFRTNKNHEILANHILDWELLVDEELYGSRYGHLENSQIPIFFDKPITFKLIFTNDIKLKPFRKLNYNILQSSYDEYAVYKVSGNWSLFKLIDGYMDCKNDGSLCTNDRLRFEIPLADGRHVILFCDVSFLNSKGEKVLIPKLPDVAPRLRLLSSNF